MTTPSIQKKENCNRHQQSQLDEKIEQQKCEKNGRTDKNDSMITNVLEYKDNNLSVAMIWQATVIV